jgi:hypothetical protein
MVLFMVFFEKKLFLVLNHNSGYYIVKETLSLTTAPLKNAWFTHLNLAAHAHKGHKRWILLDILEEDNISILAGQILGPRDHIFYHRRPSAHLCVLKRDLLEKSGTLLLRHIPGRCLDCPKVAYLKRLHGSKISNRGDQKSHSWAPLRRG